MKKLLRKIISFDERVLNRFIAKLVVSFCFGLSFTLIMLSIIFIFALFGDISIFEIIHYIKSYSLCGIGIMIVSLIDLMIRY